MLDPGFLRSNPHLISLLALFQEREDFEVDEENMSVKPLNEEQFLSAIENDIAKLDEKSEPSAVPEELCQERFLEVKNQVLENVKARWFHPGGSLRRLSNASQLSTGSKRGRRGSDDHSDSRPTKLKVTTQ